MSYQMREEPISQMMASMESLDITSMRPDIKTVRDTHDTSLWLPGLMKPRTHTIVKKILILFLPSSGLTSCYHSTVWEWGNEILLYRDWGMRFCY